MTDQSKPLHTEPMHNDLSSFRADLHVSLGPNQDDQSKLNDMMEMAKAQIERPMDKILSRSTSLYENNLNKSSVQTFTTAAASELNNQGRQSKTLDKNHKLLQDFKKKIELTQEHMYRGQAYDTDAQINQQMQEMLKDHIVSEKDRYIEQLQDQLDRQVQLQ